MAWFSVRNLLKKYDDFSLDVSIDCDQGQHLAILGPSGAGKSTLLRILAGLIPADSGQIIIDGRDVAQLPPRDRGVGMVFQDYALFPHYTVSGNIGYGMKNLRPRLSKEAMDARIADFLKKFSLDGFGERQVDALSGGERQRIALARALAVRPALMLFDEPLASLDAGLRKVLRAELRLLQRDLGYTAVSVTHDQEDALSVADKIVVIKHGTIVQSGTPEEIYSRPASAFVAGFFGETNLIPVIEFLPDGHRARTAWGILEYEPREQPSGAKSYVLSIRAEELLVSNDASHDGLMSVQVSDCEYHGRDYLVSAYHEGSALKLRQPYRPAIGQTLWVRIPKECLHLIPDDR